MPIDSRRARRMHLFAAGYCALPRLEQMRHPENQANQRPESGTLAQLVQDPRHRPFPVHVALRCSVCIGYGRILFSFYSESQGGCLCLDLAEIVGQSSFLPSGLPATVSSCPWNRPPNPIASFFWLIPTSSCSTSWGRSRPSPPRAKHPTAPATPLPSRRNALASC